MTRRQTLRSILTREEIGFFPGVHDALSAKLAADHPTVEGLQHSGYGTAASLLGLPDLDFTSLTETVATVRNMVRVAGETPVVVDADTGFGGIANLTRTVSELENTRAAGLFIEDQATPKKCGLMAGKQLVAPGEMAAKVSAACDSRRDENFVIMARTDSYADHGIDAVIDRAGQYHEAGADALFLGEVVPLTDLATICSAVDLPVYALMVRMDHEKFPPAHPISAYEEAGVSLVSDVTALLQVAVHHMQRYLDVMGEQRDNRDIEMLPLNRLTDYLGASEYEAFEAAHRDGVQSLE
ncbi:isocitrate lyase/PEP mutase family protein [Haladaptatus sp. DJG-WS-42]|uniref:isocitrate lyase/PEP mutase family protein n=1 Tax=Haladaptatus sp. DJG-WS-42 TaxID=3120516 RepID=UPI0030CAD6CE